MKLLSQIIKQTAYNYGFALCGIAKAEPLFIEKERFEKALSQNFHAKKAYLERDIDKRFNPASLLENCKSVIVCAFNYNLRCAEGGKQFAGCGERWSISKYAQIKDYHVFMKDKLEALVRDLQDKFGEFNYKTTVDSAAISEKAWAVKAGIGYYGKNGIIQTQLGSFVFLGSLLIDKEVDFYDTPNQKTCEDCGKCIMVCPVKAIVAPYFVDCNKCITNINYNKTETDFTRIANQGWLIACDECQNICPNNAHTQVNEEAVALKAAFVDNQQEILENLTPETFEHYFKDTVIYQFKYEGLKKRLEEISGVKFQV